MIAAARNALEQLVATDAAFLAELAAAGLTPFNVLRGNRKFAQIGQEQYPCVVSDAGDVAPQSADNAGGDPAGLSINSHQQDWGADIDLSFVWPQQVFDTAVNQRDALWPALAQLLLRNPSLMGTCAIAYVSGIQNDSGVSHPTHVLVASVRVVFTIYRS